MIKLRLSLDGIDGLRRDFERLDRAAQGRVQRKAVRAGSGVAVAKFRSVAPVGQTGRLKKAQAVKFRSYARTQSSVAVIGADYSIAPHAHLVEWGTTQRFRKKYSMHPKRGFTGRVQATNVFQRAFDSVRSTVQSDMENALKIGLDEAIASL